MYQKKNNVVLLCSQVMAVSIKQNIFTLASSSPEKSVRAKSHFKIVIVNLNGQVDGL